MFAGHGVAEVFQGLAVEFDEPIAELAVEMVVIGVAVVVFEDAPAVEAHLAKQPRLDQFAQGAINGRAADFAPRDQLGQMAHQLVGVEMVVMAEDLFDDPAALLGDAFAASTQKLGKTLQRRRLDFHRPQRK